MWYSNKKNTELIDTIFIINSYYHAVNINLH